MDLDGVPSMCFSGVPLYIDSGQFISDYDPTETTFPMVFLNTVVACAEIFAQEVAGK